MSLILCTDTSTKACTAAVANNGMVISKIQIKQEGYKHAEQLHDLLQSVLDEAGIMWKDLDAVAVGRGPGSYTGLRIGVSAVKGICYARKIPLIALPTLQIMAVNAASKSSLNAQALLRPMIDARRMEVYTAAYSSEFNELEKVQAHVLEEDSFAEELIKNPVYFFGDGMDKCRHLFEQHSNAHFIDDVIPAAWSMAVLSQCAFEEKMFEDVAYFEPFYLKEFLAKPPKKLI
jgi:tRNA threonylcarbamoyladenosine biosynthesis protein TsaB